MKLTVIIAAILMLTACKKGYLGLTGFEIAGGGKNLEYYVGKIPNSYYYRNDDGNLSLQVTGKPWMVVKYNPSDHHIIDFEFGLSEVTSTILDGASSPEATLDASTIDYCNKLKLVSPVALLVNWPVTAWGGTVTNGSLGAGGVIFYYTFNGNTKYTFSYLPAGSMVGGAENLNGWGLETQTLSSFNMLKL